MYWERYKLDYDINKLVEEIDTLFPRSDYSYFDNWTIPNGNYFYNVEEMPQHIVDAIERSIGYKLNSYFFLWDWRGQPKLMPHKDRKDHHEGQTELVVIVSLEGTFKLNILKDEGGEVVDSIVYSPGDITVLNNTEYYHSGELLDPSETKRSLNCYIDMEKYNGKS